MWTRRDRLGTRFALAVIAFVLGTVPSLPRSEETTWHTIRGRGFVAVLPGTPQNSPGKRDHPAVIRAEKWISELGKGKGAYIITDTEWDPKWVTPAFRDQVVKTLGEGVIVKVGGSIERTVDMTLVAGRDLWPGREVEGPVPSQDARIRVRGLFVRNHFYTLAMVYRPTVNLDAQFARMVAGFKLTSDS